MILINFNQIILSSSSPFSTSSSSSPVCSISLASSSSESPIKNLANDPFDRWDDIEDKYPTKSSMENRLDSNKSKRKLNLNKLKISKSAESLNLPSVDGRMSPLAYLAISNNSKGSSKYSFSCVDVGLSLTSEEEEK